MKLILFTLLTITTSTLYAADEANCKIKIKYKEKTSKQQVQKNLGMLVDSYGKNKTSCNGISIDKKNLTAEFISTEASEGACEQKAKQYCLVTRDGIASEKYVTTRFNSKDLNDLKCTEFGDPQSILHQRNTFANPSIRQPEQGSNKKGSAKK
jgi:hypothetical protein